MEKFDFGGWVTRNDLKCSDGRTIRHNAFKDNDGDTVPLVWNHVHTDPMNVVGNVLLENRDEGVYGYGKFNDSMMGNQARELVEHGDVKSLSIYANQLRQNGGDVLHGSIREVSLVLAGANPGAFIDSVMIHGEYSDDEAIIYTGDEISLSHSDDDSENDERTVQDVIDTMNEEQKRVLYYLVNDALKGEDEEQEDDIKHSEDTKEETMEEERTVQDVLDEMTEEQRDVVDFLVDSALSEAEEDEEEYYEEEDVKHNVFDNDYEGGYLEHGMNEFEESTIINDAKKYGSLKDSFLAHADEYGIENIDWLFPEDHNLNQTPEFIKRDTTWVSRLMGSIHHTPFSRIKSRFANITADEARAKGYLKGNLKKEEVFSLLKRSTSPQTIYKKQKLDRDDIVDITDFDVVAWLKTEMRMMLDEEIARAVLVGDGRLASDDDKIGEDHIRPIAKDADLYTIKATVTIGKDDDETAKNFIRSAIKSRKTFKGTGFPILFTTQDNLTDMLLLTDEMGRDLYDSKEKLATKMMVSDIVPVEILENQVDAQGKPIVGIIVNPADYTIGADKGGAISMFDDFDIDYNQQKYLIETRISGALTKPYSAIVLTKVSAN